MFEIVQAIPEVEQRTQRPVIVVGGLAVMCRLTWPYRATTDLDTVNRRADGEPPLLEVLIASGGEPVGPAGVYVKTPAGRVQVDVLEVADWELDHLPEDPNDRLHVTSHAWAAQTASQVAVRATAATSDRHVEVMTNIAGSGPLVAMKLQAVMNRSAAKEGTDLLDIVRLVLDPTAGPAALDQLAACDSQLAVDAQNHVDLWFVTNPERSLRRIRAVGGTDVDRETLRLVGGLISDSLRR